MVHLRYFSALFARYHPICAHPARYPFPDHDLAPSRAPQPPLARSAPTPRPQWSYHFTLPAQDNRSCLSCFSASNSLHHPPKNCLRAPRRAYPPLLNEQLHSWQKALRYPQTICQSRGIVESCPTTPCFGLITGNFWLVNVSGDVNVCCFSATT